MLLPLPDGPTIRPICQSSAVVRQLDLEPLRRLLRERHVEHPGHLLHAKRIVHRAAHYNVKTRHRYPSERIRS